MKSLTHLCQKLFLIIAGTITLASCNSPKEVIYLQDLQQGADTLLHLPYEHPITLQPDDKLSIIVNSRDAQLTDLFNLPYVSRQLGISHAGVTTSSPGTNQGISVYTVDETGYIDFPILGRLHVKGLRREDVGRLIKERLIRDSLIRNPVVTVEFANLCISVLGEVNHPGRFSIDRDHLTLLDALSLAGDMTIYGQRSNVLVLRKENNTQRVYRIDLTSSKSLYGSPAYYLKQNDVVYVEPNNMKARQSTVNGNNVRATSFWFSLASLLTSIAILIFN